METKRRQFEILRAQLENERSSFIAHWRDLGNYILPRRPRFFTSDANRGDRRNQNIIDSTGFTAARTLRSGMMSGVTSPARPWFRLTTPDPDLADSSAVKDWLHIVSQRMAGMFLKSNLYNTLPNVYGDMGTFSTAAMIIEEDMDNVMRSYSFPIGSYSIANDYRQRVNVFFREFRMTVRQIVEKFGKKDAKTGKVDWSNISDYVKNAWDRGQYESWIDICHVIQPNIEYDSKKLDSKYKKFSSHYYERGYGYGSSNNYIDDPAYDKFLSEKGYDYFPVLCPRWEVTGEDVYGTDCPGMSALGDIRALQVMQKRKAQAIEKMVNPPMVGPSSLRSVKASILPGDITYADEREGLRGFRPAHEVNPNVQALLMDVQDHRERIRKVFFEDLFLMLSTSDRRDITAREIDERHEEKLLALGPVLEQLNQDLLDPLVDIGFQMGVRQGLFPKPPDELHGVELKVEYVSIMAQAQKLVGLSAIERFAGFANQIAAVHPEAMDKVDTDQLLDVYSDITSIPPGIVRSDDDVAALRGQRQKAAQQQQQAAMIQQGAAAAKDLSQATTGGDNLLSAITGG